MTSLHERSEETHRVGPPQRSSITLQHVATLSVDEALGALDATREGLSTAEAARRRSTVGPNVLALRKVTVIGVLARQVRNPLLVLLVGAATISGFTGDPTDAVIISAVVALSVGLGFFNEYRSELAAEALHDNVRHETVAVRDGVGAAIDVADLVPGDIVEISLGAVVPADLRVLEATQLECDEAVLTGESAPREKSPLPAATSDTPLDLSSCAFMGTIVHQGSATCLVRQPTLSQQLAELREAGLVTTRRDAKQIFYSLTDARAGKMIAALEEIFCDDETRSLLKSRSQPAQKADREPARLALGSSQFAKVHLGGRSPK